MGKVSAAKLIGGGIEQFLARQPAKIYKQLGAQKYAEAQKARMESAIVEEQDFIGDLVE